MSVSPYRVPSDKRRFWVSRPREIRPEIPCPLGLGRLSGGRRRGPRGCSRYSNRYFGCEVSMEYPVLHTQQQKINLHILVLLL